jgi:hypothetical protein
VDTDALDAQVREHEARQRAEREADLRYADEMRRMKLAADAYEAEVKHAREAQARTVAAERERQLQLKTVSLDRDISDPRGSIRGERFDEATRLGYGPSSALSFDGEDPRAAERSALQAMQMREWASEQAAEKAHREAMEREEAVRSARELAEAAARADEMEAEFRRLHKAQSASVARDNLALAEEARRAREERKEMDSTVGSAWMPSGLGEESLADGDASDTLGAGRIRVDHYRGMDRQRRRDFLRDQARQAAEKEARRRQEHARVEAEAAERDMFLREAARAEALAREERERQKREHMAALSRQVEEERARREKESRIRRGLDGTGSGVTDGTDTFFRRFGASDR